MDCPNCKLINPPEAVLCDCGYDFQRRVQTSQRPAWAWHLFLPAVIAVVLSILGVLGLLAGSMNTSAPDPLPEFQYQCGMVILALMIAFPVLWMRIVTILSMLGAIFFAGDGALGWLYLPTLIAAVWVTLKQGRTPRIT